MLIVAVAAVYSGSLFTQDAKGENSVSSSWSSKNNSGNIYYDRDVVEIKGKNVTKSYKVKNFDKILSDNIVDIEYVQGPLAVKVTAPADLFNYLHVIVKGGELRIALDGKQGLKISGNKKIKAYVSSPVLKRVRNNGAADFDVVSLNADKLELDFTGSGDFEWKKGSAEKINATVSGSGDMELENLTVRNGQFLTKGSGDISLKRVNGESVALRTSGSGDIEAEDININDVTAESEGSGDIELSGVCRYSNVSSQGSGEVRDRKLKRRK